MKALTQSGFINRLLPRLNSVMKVIKINSFCDEPITLHSARNHTNKSVHSVLAFEAADWFDFPVTLHELKILYSIPVSARACACACVCAFDFNKEN